MDCMDCHNRPAHQFPTPMERVNTALADGSISQDLPFIKVQAVTALDSDYASTEEALAAIQNDLQEYYAAEYPEVLENDGEKLAQSIQTVQQIYSDTIFPEMKANWLAYPNNIGHRDSPGCFRCHNEDMQSAEGETIFTNCTGCHLILAQGESISDVNVNIEEGLPFVHPEDMEAIEEYTECFDCHTGGADIYE